MAIQPAFDLRGFVRPVVVQYQVQFPISGKLSLQLAQELQEFLMAVPAVALPHDFNKLSAANRVVVPLRLWS